MECRKCKSPGSIMLRKTDYYCDNCFITNVNHKFRACIGKNKILSANERVLICLSGGVGSIVLLNLIHNSISMDSNKKLRIIPFFIHINAGKYSYYQAENIIDRCKEYNFNAYILNISQYMEPTIELPAINSIPPIKEELSNLFSAMIDTMPATTSNDFMLRIKRDLYLKAAQKLQCRFVFTAETTTTLAIKLLTNLAIGRGSQVEGDVGFCDSRDDDVKILRPMKDITQEELQHYIIIAQLTPVNFKPMKVNCSLQSAIGEFVLNLQGTFPATISTVCKTADKIGIYGDKKQELKCVLCESLLRIENSKLSALQATKFSRTVSNSKPQYTEDLLNSLSNFEYIEETIDLALFPYIHKRLCYSCSRNYSEMNKCNIPSHIQTMIRN